MDFILKTTKISLTLKRVGFTLFVTKLQIERNQIVIVNSSISVAVVLIPFLGPSDHRCRKFFTFWERGETLRKFLTEAQFSVISRGIKRFTMPENISNIKKF